ncbi:MAG: YdcF family protein [Patescibacteria group bacterium]
MKEKKMLYILGGGLVKEGGRWCTTNFNEGDNFGASGDRLRVVAGKYWHGDNPDKLIIVSAGKGQYRDIPDAPTIAEVMKQELIALGVAASIIEKEEESGNTWQQLQMAKKIIAAKGLDKLFIMSNQWHLPRVQAMLGADEELNNLFREGKIALISAEELLLKHASAEWKEIIQVAYQSEALRARIALEQKGIRQIKTGAYNLK